MATFTITLRTREDGGGIRTLRAALKLLLRRFGLRALKVEQTPTMTELMVDGARPRSRACAAAWPRCPLYPRKRTLSHLFDHGVGAFGIVASVSQFSGSR